MMGQLPWIQEMSFARWRHFITARGSEGGYPRAVLSFEQGLMILFLLICMRFASNYLICMTCP